MTQAEGYLLTLVIVAVFVVLCLMGRRWVLDKLEESFIKSSEIAFDKFERDRAKMLASNRWGMPEGELHPQDEELLRKRYECEVPEGISREVRRAQFMSNRIDAFNRIALEKGLCYRMKGGAAG